MIVEGASSHVKATSSLASWCEAGSQVQFVELLLCHRRQSDNNHHHAYIMEYASILVCIMLTGRQV